MKKIVTKVFLGLIVLGTILAFSIFLWLNSFSPDYEESKQISTLSDSVKVIYDHHGVPHIYAKNEIDAYRVLGYTQAKDRFFQIDLFRRIGSGTLAELFGKDMLENDKFLRALQISNHAEKSIEKLNPNSPWAKGMEAYVEGVNEYIKENKPIEYYLLGTDPKPFTIKDIYHVTGYMSFSFAMAIKTEPILQYVKSELGNKYFEGLAVNFDSSAISIESNITTNDSSDFKAIALSISEKINELSLPMLIGSNSWIVSGKRSSTGSPIFANDPHISFSQPAIWYEAHIVTPEFNFYGSHLPGVPFGIIGHTLRHTWGFTMFENDDMDLYLGRKASDNSYSYKNEDMKYELIHETFNVKGDSTITKTYRKTIHGIVINDVVEELKDQQNPISLWWVYLNFDDQLMKACYNFSHSSNLKEIESAIELVHAPGLNVMYADTLGNIAWYAAAKIPNRSNQGNSKIFLDGVTGKDDILNYYPFSVNPKSINPESGYVYSANNQSLSPVDSITIPGYYLPDDRAYRIKNLLNEKEIVDIGYVQKMQLDNYSHTAHLLSKWMSEYAKGNLKTELEQFNGKYNRTSTTASKVQFAINKLSEFVFKDELGDKLYKSFLGTHVYKRSIERIITERNSVWFDNINTEEIETPETIINKIITMVNDRDFKEWQKDHILTHEHPIGSQKPFDKLFNVGPFEVGSTNESLNNYLYSLNTFPYKIHAGPSMRKIVNLSDVPHSVNIIPTGQSGVYGSQWYDDQAEMYVNGQWRPMLMTKEEITSNSSYASEYYR
ncbi:penicillin acylase family protein [Marinigracilibium pacificum]|uniref:Penicillin acylase family protein n=1 Tax=Marinigracilibium pacificum TaxID=2729599 RepID=A0A848J2L8_9BACT|nr:penicillin acylase family protein [Marinigracilibium pacificum]NMM49578.1 penicillin acylase family protein [Marinigracilibium pacificum]